MDSSPYYYDHSGGEKRSMIADMLMSIFGNVVIIYEKDAYYHLKLASFIGLSYILQLQVSFYIWTATLGFLIAAKLYRSYYDNSNH